MKNICRRRFIKNACVGAVAFGMPAHVHGAADLFGKPDLVIGLLSDIHDQIPPTVKRAEALELFRHALEYFRDRYVDGVLVSGGLTNARLETELKAVADVWFSVFPDGKLPDSSPITNLMHYGDHDAETRFYNDKINEKFAVAGLPVPQSLSEGENRKTICEKLFREPWGKDRQGHPIRQVVLSFPTVKARGIVRVPTSTLSVPRRRMARY